MNDTWNSLKRAYEMLQVTSLLAISSAVWSAQIPCTDESCSKLNVYLGPKWGSKTLRIPSDLNVRGPSGGEVDIPPADDSDVKPTDWVANSDEEVSETDWVADSNDSGDEDEDDSDWSDDSSQELNSTAKPEDRLVDTHGQIIDWVADSSTKLSAKLIQPSNKPTDWVARTERTDQSTLQEKMTSPKSTVTAELQDATKSSSRRTTPKQRSGLEDDSYAIDYTYDYEADFGFGNDDSTKTSSKTWISVDNLNELFDKGALNLTGFGFSGMYKSVTVNY